MAFGFIKNVGKAVAAPIKTVGKAIQRNAPTPKNIGNVGKALGKPMKFAEKKSGMGNLAAGAAKGFGKARNPLVK